MRGPRAAMKSGPRSSQLEKALAQKRRPNTAINKLKKTIKVVGLPVSGTRKQEREGRALNRKEALCLEGLVLLPEWGENSRGREAGWRPEVCLTKAWRPSGLGIQGAASGAQMGRPRRHCSSFF